MTGRVVFIWLVSGKWIKNRMQEAGSRKWVVGSRKQVAGIR
jgi:hypothetical protein